MRVPIRAILLAAVLPACCTFFLTASDPPKKPRTEDMDPSLRKDLTDSAERALTEDAKLIRPLEVPRTRLGEVRRVTRLGASDHYYFRVPILFPKESTNPRIVGHFDLGIKDGKVIVLRRHSRAVDEKAVKSLPPDTLELSEESILAMAKGIAGRDAKRMKDPALVYDRAETRLGWAVDMATEQGNTMTVIVTPKFAYEVKKE